MQNPLLITLRFLLVRIVAKHKSMILTEADKMTDFMRLLMKPRDTHRLWTSDEKKVLRVHLLHLSWYIPALIVFCLPGGSLLIPILAELLDRRRNAR
ncbi:MAG TPA: hypothetical protein VHO84_09745 [Syntrophorhabdaceae bacterium]|nr:hypothetical protein [Syntrophorhabdaceae bacterium]